MIKKGLIIVLLFGALLLAGCSKCESGQYDAGGKCCEMVCTDKCPGNALLGSCGCTCEANPKNNGADTNIGDVFDDNGDINPPTLP